MRLSCSMRGPGPTPLPAASHSLLLVKAHQTLLQALDQSPEGTGAFPSHRFPREETNPYSRSYPLGIYLFPF